MKAWRIILASGGIALGLFGALRLLTQIPGSSLILLALWLVGAVIIHDGVLSPLVVSLGWTLRRLVPDRARRHIQAALIMSALVIVIAIPMIYLRGSQPASKALLQRDYGANLGLIMVVIAVLTLIHYAVDVARTRSGRLNRGRSGPSSQH